MRSSSFHYLYNRRGLIPRNYLTPSIWYFKSVLFDKISLNSLPLKQGENRSPKPVHSVYPVVHSNIQLFDLPLFATFETGLDSFANTTSIALSSIVTISFSLDTPFKNGTYAKNPWIHSYTFRRVTADSIIVDSSIPLYQL